MCMYCRSIPHLQGCPEAPEPEPLYVCSICDKGIFEGEKYYDSPNGCVCESCIDSMTASEFMELTEERLSTAEREVF